MNCQKHPHQDHIHSAENHNCRTTKHEWYSKADPAAEEMVEGPNSSSYKKGSESPGLKRTCILDMINPFSVGCITNSSCTYSNSSCHCDHNHHLFDYLLMQGASALSCAKFTLLFITDILQIAYSNGRNLKPYMIRN